MILSWSFVGEIGDSDKAQFLGHASALLFPINWPEPFGLVMIEAMACGTPVIAWNCGSVPEVIQSGVNGFVVNSEAEAELAIRRIPGTGPSYRTGGFERSFTSNHHGKRLSRSVFARLVFLPACAGRPAQGTGFVTLAETPQCRRTSRTAASLHAQGRRPCFCSPTPWATFKGAMTAFFPTIRGCCRNSRWRWHPSCPHCWEPPYPRTTRLFTAHLTNRPLPILGDVSIPQGVIHIERSRFLHDSHLYERLRFSNYSGQQATVPLRLAFAADFADIFEVQGHRRAQRGALLAPEVSRESAVLAYRGRDEQVRRTQIRFSRRPLRITGAGGQLRTGNPALRRHGAVSGNRSSRYRPALEAALRFRPGAPGAEHASTHDRGRDDREFRPPVQ